MSMKEYTRRARRLRRNLRRKEAIETILKEIQNLKEKYSSNPDIVDHLFGIETMLKQQLEKVLEGIRIQEEKLRALEKQL